MQVLAEKSRHFVREEDVILLSTPSIGIQVKPEFRYRNDMFSSWRDAKESDSFDRTILRVLLRAGHRANWPGVNRTFPTASYLTWYSSFLFWKTVQHLSKASSLFEVKKSTRKSTCDDGFELRFRCLQRSLVGDWAVAILWSKSGKAFSGGACPRTLSLTKPLGLCGFLYPGAISWYPPVKNRIETPAGLLCSPQQTTSLIKYAIYFVYSKIGINTQSNIYMYLLHFY